MDFIYMPGDVVFFKNVMFNDSDGQEHVDTRIAGHPFLILNEVKEFGDKCYALKITSRRIKKITQYHLERCATLPWLRKESFVNLNKVYEFRIDKNIIPRCCLKSWHLTKIRKLLQKF